MDAEAQRGRDTGLQAVLAALLLAGSFPAVRAQELPEKPVAAAGAPEVPAAPQTGETDRSAPARRTRLVGKAFLGRNRDVVGATVLARSDSDPSRVYLTSSDDGGGFWVGDLPDGAYTVRVLRSGLLPVVKEAVGLRFPFRAVVEVRMQPDPAGPGGAADERAPDRELGRVPVGVFGEVRERGGTAVAETRIRLLDRSGNADPLMGETGEDGSFRFERVPPGRWSLEIVGVGYVPIRTTVDLVTDTTLGVGLVKQPPGYQPSPLDLMPLERPVAPVSLR